MRLSVSETAEKFAVSVRTLHYYDEIGLVTPSFVTDAGYRFYDDAALSVLQQVLFYRELDFPLKEIARILHTPEYNPSDALQKQRKLLLLKRQHLDELLRVLDETLGGTLMKPPKTTLQDIENTKKQYAAEVTERWGATPAYAESTAKEAGKTDTAKLEETAAADAIFAAFAENMDKEPGDAAVQQLVARWQAHITQYHYNCTKEILSCLGEMYTADERFTQNLDRFGDGTAAFMRDAIRIYCS